MIYVISHKSTKRVTNDFYKIIAVGASNNKDVEDWADFRDDLSLDGITDEISNKNQYYCELTGSYWLWKHCKDEVVGICHYRRFFTTNREFCTDLSNVIDEKLVAKILEENDIILPPIHNFRLPVFHYSLRIYDEKEALIVNEMRNIIQQKYPSYLHEFDNVNRSYQSYVWNMMICKKKLFDSYCDWLFNILFELENRLTFDWEKMDVAQKRLYGYLSERLLTVWVLKNKLKIYECDVMFTEEDRSLKGQIQKWLHYKTKYISSNSVFSKINTIYDRRGYSNKFMKKR